MEVALRLRRGLQELHAHRLAREVHVAIDFARAVARRDHLAVPGRGASHDGTSAIECSQIGHDGRALPRSESSFGAHGCRSESSPGTDCAAPWAVRKPCAIPTGEFPMMIRAQ